MTDELMEQRMAELNARNTEKRLLLTAKKGPTPWTILWLCWILAAHLRTF